MVPVFMLFYSWYRSLNEPDDESRTRRRMVGDDIDIDDIVDDDRFSEPQWSSSGHPVLTRRLSDLSVKVGARARFLVEVSSPTPVSVRWEKDGRTVDESDRINMVTEGNFHCLDISPVCQEDGGLWRVKVTNMVGIAMTSAQLTLLVPKAYKKPEFVEPLRAVLTAQGTVSLECKVIGVPTPLLRWFKGANEIKAGDVLALTPNAADPTSLGTYTCLAANCMGTAESTSIVHIDGTPAAVQGFLPTGPKPIFAKELRNEKAKLGGSVTLECKVTVPPWPEAVNWYGPTGEIVESSRMHIMEDGAGLYSLKIACVTAEDNGTWKCVATNKHGAKAISTSLISVNYPKNYRKPKFLESLKAVLTEEGLVSFECKVVGYPTPNLSWFKDGQELKPGDVYQLTGTNSLGSYCCIARNCMGEAQSSAELTLEDIKSQLSEEEKIQLSSEKLPPRFVSGLKSVEAKINESLRLSIKVSVFPEPTVIWFRDDEVIEDSDRYKIEKDKLGVYHMNINKLEFCDQAEWKCVATNDYGQSVTSNFVKLNIPKHFKKPKFLEDLKAVMSEEGAVNLECKVIGVPQPKLKWFKDGKELKPGDIHKIISGQDGTCCLGTYTCLAQNCMGSVSSSASLLGFEGQNPYISLCFAWNKNAVNDLKTCLLDFLIISNNKAVKIFETKTIKEKGEKSTGVVPDANRNGQVLSRDRSLSTIHEERTSQLHDTDKSTTIDDRAEEVSFSFDGKEVSVSLYETPDLTEEEALQIVEMYADQISEHVTEQNVVELPPMRFTKESSTSGKLVMEAVVIDVSPEYFSSTPAPRKVVEDDLRTDADVDEFSLVEELNTANLSPDRNLSPIENLTLDKLAADFAERTPPSKPPRSKNKTQSAEEEKVLALEENKASEDKTLPPKRRSKKRSTDSEKEDDSLQEFERRKTRSSEKQVTTERKRTDSEVEDDSLYEFESRKTKDDAFKSCKEDEQLRYSTETGFPRTPENESLCYSPLKSPVSAASKMTEDEATFDTAEDSAFDKSEISVLETLAHSLHEIQKNLSAVEAHVVSDSSTGDMQSAQGISEFLAEPLAEVQKSLEIVEAQIQEFPTGKYSSDVLETLIQPITKFKQNLALLEEKSFPSILESVAGPLEELNREISHIQQATQSQIEYAKSVEQVQESLTKIIERQSSVPSDRKLMDSISSELEKLEEKANDDLEAYYDRLLTVGTELRSKANEEEDQEVQDILKAVGDLVKPLKRLTAVTSKCIAIIVEDNQMGNIPTKKIVESLLKPLDALDASLSLLESVGMLKSHKTIRGAGIPILYKVSVPMEELETTIKLVENLSAHSAVEFLIPPLDNLIKVVNEIDVSRGGDGFLEDLQGEGTPIVKNLDDSLDIMLNCIHSVDRGVTMVDSERGIPGKLPALLKPMEDLQNSLKAVEKGILSMDIGYEDVFAIAQELSKPLQSIRSEFSILQHEIEADHYSSDPNPSQTALTTLVEPLEGVQNCISAFHETIMCKSADDPMHLRFILYALKELTEPLSTLSGKMIKAEEILLGKGDPFQGLKAVARSVSELRESSSAVTTESNDIEQVSNILSQPLSRVQNGLENILQFVDKKDKHDLNKDLLKTLDEPFKELQSALLKIEGNIHENVTEGVTPELRQAVQELQRSILIIQDQSSFEYGDEPSTIEANIDTLQSLTQPLQTLHAQFSEVQRSANRTLIKADRALTSLKDSTRRVAATITELKSKRVQTSVTKILQVLGATVEELETAIEDANLHLGRGKRVDDTRRVLANTLKVASSKLGEVCSKADDMSVSIEPSKRKSLVLVQDFIHNLKVAIEQSTKVIDCDKGTAVDRSRDTLIAIEQLALAMTGFHDQLKSVDEFTSSASDPQSMSAMKEQVDKLQANIEKALSSNIPDKNNKMILETIENDVKSVQRVLDNLLSEDAADGARVRFILAKTESIHSDLKDMVQPADSPPTLKSACQAALTVLDIGNGLMNRKSPMQMEIVTRVCTEPEVSVIGELLETLDELDKCFNKLKREAKIKIADKEVAEMAMEIATLQALVQDIATEASGELLDKVVEVCIPIKAIEVKLSQTTYLTHSDMEETSESLHNINQVLNFAIRKKEAEKLLQPSTSIIGELLEMVGDLEASFDRLKRSALPNDATESEVNNVGREILALQNVVDDLTSEATGELLDRAQEICIPIKSIESSLKNHAILTKASICETKEKLKSINQELQNAIAQNEVDKQKREKEFEKLFSSESLSSSVDIPLVRSIVTTIEYMQAHLNSLIVPVEMVELKIFLERFECSLVQYGENLTHKRNEKIEQECLSEIEAALITADFTRVEVRKLAKAVEGLKSSQGEMPKALRALQSVLSPLKTLHEELSRPNSPKRLKKAELKYLESFSKSSTDLELGLMKMEKAIVTGTKLDVDCMAVPVEQLASFIDGISHEPSLKNLDEESSITALKSLAEPINTIQTIVAHVQEATVRNDGKKAADLLTAIAKPVRELRTNIALIQDQAMMNCSLSQLDELKQAVALMTQVGTETPGLKQPLLQLQARLQELEPEAELAEVVSELTGPVDALKQAVVVLETKGENSMLLELCHQVVDIINRSDDTLSEMSSIGPLSIKADALPAEALLKAATLCHELMEDQSLSELSHTDDTLTPTHAAEQLPSMHGAATAEQRVLLEQVESLKTAPLSLSMQEAVAKGGSVAGQLNAAVLQHEIAEDQTLSELSEIDNSLCATLAAEKLPSIRATITGEQKLPLEEAESFDKSLITTTEAVEKGVSQEHVKIATTELNVLEDHSLSELSPNDTTNSGTLPLEKLTSVRGTVAAEEKLVYEQAQSLVASVMSTKEAKIGETSITGKLNAASAGLVVATEEQNLSELSLTDGSASLAVGSPNLADPKEAAVAQQHLALEEAEVFSDTSLSTKEVSVQEVSARHSAQMKTAEVLQGPSQLSIAEALSKKDIALVADLKNIVATIVKVPESPPKLNEELVALNKIIENMKPTDALESAISSILLPIAAIEKVTLQLEREKGKSMLYDVCRTTIEAVKKQEKILYDKVDTKLKVASQLLSCDKQDVLKLKKAIQVLVDIPPIKEMSVESVRNIVVALNTTVDHLSPLSKPEVILRETAEPIKQLKQVTVKLESDRKESQILDLCQKIVQHVELGKQEMQKEAAQLLTEEIQDVTKLKKAVAILIALPKEEDKIATTLAQPLAALNDVLEKLGPLTKPEEVLKHTVEPVNALKASITDIQKSGEVSRILEVVQLVIEKADKNKQVVQDEIAKMLKGDLQDLSNLKRAVTVMVSISKDRDQKADILLQPLVALKAKLDVLSPHANAVEVFKGTVETVETLKPVISNLREAGGKSKLLDICDLLIQQTEQGKIVMQTEVSTLLKGEVRDLTTLKKAVASLVEIPIEKAQRVNVIIQPLAALQAKLETLSPKAEPIDILQGTLEPVKALKQVVSHLKNSGEQSQLLEMCEIVIQKTEQGKEAMQKEVAQLLKGEAQEVKKLQKAVAILIDIPKDIEHKVSNVNAPLVALQAKLDQLGPSAKPDEILRCILEPIKALKQVVSEIKLTGEKSQLIDICQMVVEKAEQGKEAMQIEVAKLLKGDIKDVSTLTKAVATLVEIPKEKGQNVDRITQPLAALQAKLEQMNPKCQPTEILRGTTEQVRELKLVLCDLKQSGEKSQLLEICELLVQKTEQGKEAMKKEVAQLLKGDLKEVAKLQKAVAILIDIPKDEERKLSIVNEPLIALQAKLECLGPSAKPEQVLKCTLEQIRDLKQVVSEVKVHGVKSQLMEICEMVVEKVEEGKEAMQKEAVKLLKGDIKDVSTLTKAVATLVEIPKEKGQNVDRITQPLAALQAKLEQMNTKCQPTEILRGTKEQVRELKQVLCDLKESGEKSQLLEICELVIEKTEQGKEAMEKEVAQLLKADMKDVAQFQKAVALLIDIPKDRERELSIVNEPLVALQAKLESLGLSAKPEEVLMCTADPINAFRQAVSEVKARGKKSNLLDICEMVVNKVEQGKEAVQKEVTQLLKDVQTAAILKKAVSKLVTIPLERDDKIGLITQPLVALNAKLESMSPQADPIDILRGTLEPVRELKQVVSDLQKSGEKSQLLEICELVIRKSEHGKEAMQKEAAKLLKGEWEDVSKLKKAVALLVDVPKDKELKISAIHAPLLALQGKLDELGDATAPHDIVVNSSEPVQNLKKVVTDVKQTGEKSELLQISKLVMEKITQCTDIMQREATELLSHDACNVDNLSRAVCIIVDIPKERDQRIAILNEPLNALQAKLATLSPLAKPEEIVRGTLEPIRKLKGVVKELKKEGEKSKLVEICEDVIGYTDLGKESMQMEATQLVTGDLQDLAKLKKAVALLVDIPKDEIEEAGIHVTASLTALQAKLDKLTSKTKRGEIYNATVKDVENLKEELVKFNATGEKSSLVEIYRSVIKHIETGKEKEKTLGDVEKMIGSGVRTISQLSEVMAILSNFNTTCEPLKQPFTELQSRLFFLHESSNIEDFVPDLTEPMRVLNKSASSLDKVSVQNELLKNTIALVEHLEPIFHLNELEKQELQKKEIQEKSEQEKKQIAKKAKFEQEKKEEKERLEREKKENEEKEKKGKLEQEEKEKKKEERELKEAEDKAKLEIEEKEKRRKLKEEEENKSKLEREEHERKLKEDEEKQAKLQEEEYEKNQVKLEKEEKEKRLKNKQDRISKLEIAEKEKQEKERQLTEEEKKSNLEKIWKLKEEEDRRARLEKEEKAKLEKERKLKEEEESKTKLEKEANEKKEKEKKLKEEGAKPELEKEENERKLEEEEEKTAKLEKETNEKKEKEKKLKEEEAKAKLEKEEKERKLKEEEEKNAKLEKEAKEKKLKEEEAKAKLEKEEKERKIKEDEKNKAKLEKEAKEKKLKEEEAKAKLEKEEKERKIKEEEKKKAKLEKEAKEKKLKEEEAKAKLEKEENERKQKEEEKKDKLKKEEEEKKEKEKKLKEEEAKAKLEKEEKERKQKEELEKKAKLKKEEEEKKEKEKKLKEEEAKAKLEKEAKERKLKEEKKANLEKEDKEKKLKEEEERLKLEKELEDKEEKDGKQKEEEEKAKLEKEDQEKSKKDIKLEENAAKPQLEKEEKDKKEKETKLKEEEEKKAKLEKEEKEMKERNTKEDDEKKVRLQKEENENGREKTPTDGKRDQISKIELEKKKKEEENQQKLEAKDKPGDQTEKGREQDEKEAKSRKSKNGKDKKEILESNKQMEVEEVKNNDIIEQEKKKEEGDKENAEKSRRAREKQQSLSYVEELLCSGLTVISQLKEVVDIMRLYKHVCKPLAEPLDGMSVIIEGLYEKSLISDFVMDLLQPMLNLKRAVDTVDSVEESGLLSVCVKVIDHLDPVLHVKDVYRKERRREECEKLKLQKAEEEAQAKIARSKEEELEKERIDAELRKAKAKAEEEKKEEEAKKKQLREEKKAKEETQRKGSCKETKKEQGDIEKDGLKQEIKTDANKVQSEERQKKEDVDVKGRMSKNLKYNGEVKQKEKERKEREEKQIQEVREKFDEEERVRKEKEKIDKENKALEERRKLDQVKEEVEQRERNIKAKLEQVKREKRELEMEEQSKMLLARKQERERQEQEEIVRKEKEESRLKKQQEREVEMKKQRLKELERREAELESMRSRESLRMAHLDDLHKREVAKGISRSLDAVYLTSAEKLNKGPMGYSSSVTTMSIARDTGVHSSRGISVVELLDYQPLPVRPERTKKSLEHRKMAVESEFNKDITISKWESRLRNLSPDTRRWPKELTTYTTPTYDSNQDMTAYSWDKSKEQNWRHLEYPMPDYEGPSTYHRSRRSVSPMREFGSTQSVGGTRYQAAPQQQNLPYHRSRRSMSPLERSINQPYTGSNVSLTSVGSRKHIDELTAARLRPPTPTRAYVPTRSGSIPRPHQRAYIVNGLVDKTVIHGGKIRLSCNIGGDPNPSIEWMKDGKAIAYHTEASRYKTECNYGVACLEVVGARLSDAGQYTCVVKNVDGQTATTCTVRVALNDDDDKEWESIENELEANMPREVCLSIKGSAFGMPRVTGLVADPVVPSGGTIAVHVQVAGCHRPEVTWLYGDAPLPKYSPRVHYFEDGGLFTLLLEGATPAESGVYTCRVSGRGRGAVDTTTTVQVVEKRGHEKPAIFTAKPDSRMTLTAGDDMTLTCYVGGEPRPQVTLTKGIKDITTSCRTLKEIFGEYVRLTLKRVTLEDRGTFFIIAKNIYGTDRTFVTLDVRERAKSLTPPSWSERTVSLTSLFKEVHHTTPSWRSAANLHSSYSSLYE